MKSFAWWAGVMLVACGTPGPTDTDDTDTDETDVVVDPIDAILALTGDSTAGATLYERDCELCHTADGSGTGSFPSVLEASDRLVVENVLTGPGLMPDAEELGQDDQDVADVLAYVKTL